jgi:hypothetical protein
MGPPSIASGFQECLRVLAEQMKPLNAREVK